MYRLEALRWEMCHLTKQFVKNLSRSGTEQLLHLHVLSEPPVSALIRPHAPFLL